MEHQKAVVMTLGADSILALRYYHSDPDTKAISRFTHGDFACSYCSFLEVDFQKC